jgi:hypothetical protein
MRNPSFLKKLQEQLEMLSLETVERVNKGSGLCVSDIFDLTLNPRDHSVDFYCPVEPSSLEGLVLEDSLKNLGIVLYVNNSEVLERSDVKEFFNSSFPIWLSCPSSIFEYATRIFPAENVIVQNEFIALTPDNYLTSTDDSCLYTCGPGDAIACLTENEQFKVFSRDPNNDVYLIDLETSRCFIDKSLIAAHRKGLNVTIPVMPSTPNDKSAVLCSVNGCPQLLERFLFMSPPEDFDYTHAGHLIFRANLKLDMIRWTWHRRKLAVNGVAQVHHKRYLYDITEAYDSKFVQVSRDLYTLS